MDNLLQKLREKGYKMTPQRRAVANALAECGEFPSAQKLLEHIKLAIPDISLDTIYRNLSLLVELGLVQEIHLPGREGNVYEVVDCHHHHLICLRCGKAACLDHCPIDHHKIAKAEKHGFEITSHALEFYGYCRTCRVAG